MSLRIIIRTFGIILFSAALVDPAVGTRCKCHRPQIADVTRLGGNEAIVIIPPKHFQQIRGIVEAFENEAMEDALVEVFDNPGYLVSNKPWPEKPAQNRLRRCVTSSDGKFCFRGLRSGVYELRISKDQGWNVIHAYVLWIGQLAKKTGCMFA